MGTKKILAFDLGTGGNKAVLYDADGSLLSKAFSPYETDYSQSGWAEQRPMDWWDAIVNSTQHMLSQTRIDNRDIGCISISGQGIGVVPVNKKGALLRKRTPIWSDSRALKQMKKVLDPIGIDSWYMVTGAALRPENYAAFKIMWFCDHEKEMFNETYKFLGTKDFINMKMTGQFATDFSDASFSGVYDLINWKYSTELIEATGLPREKFPELYPSTHVIGELQSGPAKELQLTAGIPVVLGGYGGSCTAVGAGNITENRVYNYIGSSSWISVASEKALFEKKIKPYIYAHVIPNMYNSTVSIYSAGSSYQWIKDNICTELVETALEADVDPYELMEQEAKKAPLGSRGLLFNPSFMGGATIHPSPHIRGAYMGLGLSHEKSDLIRAAMEGIAFDLRMVLDAFRSLGVTADEIRTVGGGSKSMLWRQIFSSIYNARIIRTNVGQEAAALGAATIGAVGVGIWKNFSIVDDISMVMDVSNPDVEKVHKYEKILSVYIYTVEKLLEIGEKMVELN
jgi:xylulokinase